MSARAKRIIGPILAVAIVAVPYGYAGWLEYRSRQLPQPPPGPNIMVKGRIVYTADPARYRCEEDTIRRRYLTV
jgi:hypothetical protein